MKRLILVVIMGALTAGYLFAFDWPVWPDSSSRPVSAVYGLWFQNPGELPKMHSGIDIAVPEYQAVYAVESGYVKAIITRQDHPSYWRIVIGDSAGTGETDAWMYAHVDRLSIAAAVGDWVERGDSIAAVADWPYWPDALRHLHFSKIRYYGDSAHWADNEPGWEFIGNPLDEIGPINDLDVPALENALGDQLLAFCRNEDTVYFPEGSPISGDVDIICRAYDYHNFYGWENVPYSLEYKIDGDSSIPWTMSACFTGYFGTYDDMAEYTYIVFQDDSTCNTDNNPGISYAFYFNLTNSDGDTLVEASDKSLCWQTPYFPNGEYKITVRARDKSDNAAVDSMTVTVANFFTVSGTVTYGDGNPTLAGAVITAAPGGQCDTTDVAGAFELTAVASGPQTVTFRRLAYETTDTTLFLVQDEHLEMTLAPASYLCGDADGSWTHNLLDATFIINYLYKNGSPPAPEEAADADGSGSINLLDVTHIINYLYKEGPAPICPVV